MERKYIDMFQLKTIDRDVTMKIKNIYQVYLFNHELERKIGRIRPNGILKKKIECDMCYHGGWKH